MNEFGVRWSRSEKLLRCVYNIYDKNLLILFFRIFVQVYSKSVYSTAQQTNEIFDYKIGEWYSHSWEPHVKNNRFDMNLRIATESYN